MRAIQITPHFQRHPEGSALIAMGQTKVICSASIEPGVPRWRRDSGAGWVTAEYAMLPRATNDRTQRDGRRGNISGRTSEIQRLIGRSLRSVVDMEQMGEFTITVDCDVLEADGGTRTASITGASVALWIALERMRRRLKLPAHPMREHVSAISVGVVEGETRLDLEYEEDSQADVDMNVVLTAKGEFVELQGTAEGQTFDDAQLTAMLGLGKAASKVLNEYQTKACAAAAASLD
jgi:ribonuclease PH